MVQQLQIIFKLKSIREYSEEDNLERKRERKIEEKIKFSQENAVENII